MPQSFVSFRDVGIRQFETNMVNQVSQSAMPVGIKTPMTFGQQDQGFLTMNMTLSDQIQDNFRNLLLTNHGERLMFFDYGANIRPLATEYNSVENFDQEAMIRINTAVAKYMPFLQLEGFRSDLDQENNHGIALTKVSVQYSVPRAQIGTRVLEVTITAI